MEGEIDVGESKYNKDDEKEGDKDDLRRETEELIAAAEEVKRSLQRFLDEGINTGVWTSGVKDAHLKYGKGIDGLQRLLKKVDAEQAFQREMVKNESLLTIARVRSSNLGLFRGIEQVMLGGVGGLVSCQRTFYSHDKSLVVEVDVVAGNGSIWIKVKGMNNRNIHDILQGKGRYGEKSVIQLAEDMLTVAGDSKIHFGTPLCVMVFTNNEIDESVLDAVRTTGVRALTLDSIPVIAEYIRPPPALDEDLMLELAAEMGGGMDDSDEDSGSDPFQSIGGLAAAYEECSSVMKGPSLNPIFVQKVNLDVTALFALTSDLTNGHNGYHFPDHVVLEQQAKDDRRCPVFPILQEFLAGKQVFICETAKREYENILEQVAGSAEKRRALEFMQHVQVYPDHPSEQAQQLTESARVKKRQKVIFGTGDTLRAITVTANVQFVQAAADQGVHFTVFVHPARALTERKRLANGLPVGE
ncbi:hypothetical protein DIPPA_70122 [Diplonema papillatum]|nr:hypothetical protein DIPPA_70122 [Diplonema papillatum]